MNARQCAGTRARRSLLIVLCTLVQLLMAAGATARQTAPSPPSLDPACVRFDDPNAVVNGEIVYAGFTAYASALDHAVTACLRRGVSPSPSARRSLPAMRFLQRQI
jgi:hypothetical protein